MCVWVLYRTTHDLDAEVSASGFTRGMQMSLKEEVSRASADNEEHFPGHFV